MITGRKFTSKLGSQKDYPENLDAIWDEHFGFVMNDGIGHLYLGEFGIKEVDGSGGRANLWFERLLSYMGTSYSWAFWSPIPTPAIPVAF